MTRLRLVDEALLDDPLEIGRRIAGAIGYAKRKKKTQAGVAKAVGVSPPTLLEYTKGNLGEYSKSKDEVRLLVEKVEAATECPPAWFGLSAPETAEVAQLRQEFEEKLQREVLRVTKERVEALASIEDRLSRLEAGGWGAGSPDS